MKEGLKNFSILVVEDEEISLKYLTRFLEKEGYYVDAVSSGKEALAKINNFPYNLVILDLCLPDIHGLEVLSQIKKSDPEINVIIITAYGSIETAVEAIKLGASDYITKPLEMDELLLKIKNYYEKFCLQRENIIFKSFQKFDEKKVSEEIILTAKSPKMKEILDLIENVKDTDTTILLTGETGTGKTLLAKYIHYTSKRKNAPFIFINCSVYTEELLASELFGYEKGAFTGAVKAKPGLIELAQGGTLFLDEITEISVNLQSKLLKVLEDKEVLRLGGIKPIKVDVRIIAATNRDLKTEIERGTFRKDLYYRLSVLEIYIPPLRERKEDIPSLLELFIKKYNQKFNKKVKGLTKEALEIILKYDFPGNVRELENIIERAVLLAKGEFITPELFPHNLQLASIFAFHPYDIKPLDQVVKEYVQKVLEYFEGNRTKAAEVLGISRTTLWRIFKEDKCS